MNEIKLFLYGAYDVVAFPILLVLIFFIIRARKEYAASLFVWGCSFPVTLYCYIVYIYGGLRSWSHWSVVAIDFLAFSQLGWLGAILMLFGYFANDSDLKKAGVCTSIVSVASHGFFLMAGIVWHWLS